MVWCGVVWCGVVWLMYKEGVVFLWCGVLCVEVCTVRVMVIIG